MTNEAILEKLDSLKKQIETVIQKHPSLADSLSPSLPKIDEAIAELKGGDSNAGK